jgi:hypothetical protein
MQKQFDRKQHGSLFDRGSADSYYGRPQEPHWYPEGSYNGNIVTTLTPDEVQEYLAGYAHNEQFGGKKDWD